ncbi:MAG: TonB-dependent receptor domain-containing protein [Symbiopectobacterium sp.]
MKRIIPMTLAGDDGKGNPYKPTMGKQTEVGMKYTPHGFNGYATVALYNLVRDNVSTTDREHPGRSAQTGQVRSRGIELEMSGEVARGLTVLTNITMANSRSPSWVRMRKLINASLSSHYSMRQVWSIMRFMGHSTAYP